MRPSENIRRQCRFCRSLVRVDKGELDCASCLKKGTAIGRVVWKRVLSEVRSAPKDSYVLFMLTGLSARALEGIVRESPGEADLVEGRTWLMRLHPKAATDLNVRAPARKSKKPATHWRHSREAQVKLFAVPDRDRLALGASLGEVVRIDEDQVIGQVEDWVSEIDSDPELDLTYMTNMLGGLGDSKIRAGLDMWVDFVYAMSTQDKSLDIDQRVQDVAHTLQIPNGSISGLPTSSDRISKTERRRFMYAFDRAEREVKCFPMLETRGQGEQIDPEVICKAIQSFPDQSDEAQLSFAHILTLISDRKNIGLGDWRCSQENFCKHVPWHSIGAQVFRGGARRVRRNLGQETLDFIKTEVGSNCLSQEDMRVLENMIKMGARNPKEPIVDEINFYARWQDLFGRPDAKRLNSAWRKRISEKVIFGDDLVTVLFDGFTALLDATGDALSTMDNPKMMVRAGKSSESKYWSSREPRALKQFQFELRSLKGLLDGVVEWDVDACLSSELQARKSYTTESRHMELTLCLLEGRKGDEDANEEKFSSPIVSAIWRPDTATSGEPISFGLSEDIEALATCAENNMSIFRELPCKPASKTYDLSGSQISLYNTESFRDVYGDHGGRLFRQCSDSKGDVLEEIKTFLDIVKSAGNVDKDSMMALCTSIEKFEEAYKKMIIEVHRDTEAGFSSHLIDDVAEAYGNLCSATRQCNSSEMISNEVSVRIASLGIVEVDDGLGTVILAGWHPFRLVERKAKIKNLSNYILETISSTSHHILVDTSLSHIEQRRMLSEWTYPEIIVSGKDVMTAVENLSGYGLFSSSDAWKATSTDKVHRTSVTAAQALIDCIDRYLRVHPYKETFLSVSIFESEEEQFPKDVINHLIDKVHAMPNLHCNLVLTQKRKEGLSNQFQHQNQLLQAFELGDTSPNFLPRLRVSACLSSDLCDENSNTVDIAFSYGVISKFARFEWIFEPVATDALDSEVTLKCMIQPRRWLTDSASTKEAIYVTLPNPPRSIAEYNNLVYEVTNRPSSTPKDCHSAYIRSVDYDDSDISKAVNQSHDIADWVVTYDLFANKTLLQRNGISIIRDVSAPSIEGRQIISTKVMDTDLQNNIRSDLKKILSVGSSEMQDLCDKVVENVLNISGQKLLTAAQSITVSHEVIGISIMKAMMESSSKVNPESAIWLSLDDHRSWLLPGRGKCADAILISVADEQGVFKLNMQVGEAKFVSRSAKSAAIENSGNQLRQTLKTLEATFVDNLGSIASRSACSRLAKLLGYQSGLQRQLTSKARLRDFISALSLGNVKICITGEAVICVHDDERGEVESYYDDRLDHISYCILPTKEIAKALTKLLEGKHVSRNDLVKAKWHCSTFGNDAESDKENSISQSIESIADGDTNASPDIKDQSLRHEKGQILLDNADEGRDTSTSDAVENNNEDTGSGVEREETKIQTPTGGPLEILSEMKSQEESSTEDIASLDWAEEMCGKVQEALRGLRMQAKFADPRFRLTPSGILISFRGHQTLTAGKVRRKISELLTIYCIHVVDIREGVGTVSLFIEREARVNVGLASTWLSISRPKEDEYRALTFLIGVRDDDGSPLFLNLAEEWSGYEEHGPHTLIGGETGSGKGVFTQGILLQLLTFNDPKDVQLIVIDPKKGVDYNWVTGFPHLREELVTEVERAHETFHCLVEEMEKRYELFEKEDAGDIKQYNSKVTAEKRIPRIVLVHDELGAWMAQVDDYRDTVLSYVANLGMKSRAAGIHLVLITQRADADAVPPRLRDNMGNRFCFKVQNMIGSKMVLGKGGAERLLGKGHLACHLANQGAPVGQEYFLVQVPYANVEDLRRLANAALSRWGAS